MTSLNAPFFTDIDPRNKIKGSRDPLGAQSVWTRVGRHMVGNLTTVTTSVIDFTTVVLGYYFVDRVAERDGPGQELATFLQWEQLAAYCRAGLNEDPEIRGIDRVKQALSEGDGRVDAPVRPGIHFVLGLTEARPRRGWNEGIA